MPKPINTARSRPEHPDPTAHPAPTADPARAVPPADDAFLHRTLPGRQQYAKAFLAGEVPGVQARYAPDAQVSEVEGWVEDDDTVDRLVDWREEAIY